MNEDDRTVAGSMGEPDKRPLRLPPGTKVFIEVTEGPDLGRKLQVTKVHTVIGRRDADLILTDPTVSSRHALLEVVPEGIFIYDENSTNGTKVNGERVTSAQVRNMDEIQVGDTRLLLSVVEDKYAMYEEEPSEPSSGIDKAVIPDKLSDTTVATKPLPNPELPDNLHVVLEVLEGPDKGHVYRLTRRSTVVGRGSRAFIRLSDDTVSQSHFQIEVYQKDKITLKDLASKNGTKLNGKFISAVKLHHGDKIEVGTTVLRLLIKT